MISTLAALCRDHLVAEKILIAPSLAIGHQLGDRIAQDGTPWINLRVETIRTLADAVASFELVREGTTVLSRAQALALVERACDLAFGRDGSYFAAIATRPGLHRAMQRSLDDLRNAGLRAADMPPEAFEDPGKASDLQRVLNAYETLLNEGCFTDRAGVLDRAIRLLEGGAKSPYPAAPIWIIAENSELSSHEERFLELVAGRSPIRISGDTDAWRDVRTPMHIVRAVGEENEVRGAFRDVLRSGSHFDTAELLYTERSTYLPLIHELAAEHAVAATFAEGIPASFTRPGAAALGFLAWVGGGFESAEIETLLRAGAIDPHRGKRSGPSTLAMARAMRNAGIGWGRERYAPRLISWRNARAKVLTDSELPAARLAAAERDVASASAALEIIETLLTLSVPLSEPEVRIEALASSTATFVRESSAIRNEIDGMAARALDRLLSELSSLPVAEVSAREAADRLAQAIGELHVAASNPRPGHLHVAPLRLGGWSGRPRTFIVGFDDSRHPGVGNQDPVLLDAERKAMNPDIAPKKLSLMSDRPARNVRELHLLLSRATDTGGPESLVTLSYSSRNLQDERERYPSITLLEIARQIRGEEEITYEDLVKSIAKERVSFVPDDQPLSGTEWWLSRVFGMGNPAALEPRIERSYPWLGNGAEAKRARGSSELTKWDGAIEPAEALDPRLSGAIVSASRLERLASCPFRYFLENVLRIQPLEELERDPERWLSPADFGSMLHEVLETFMKEICGRGEKPSLQLHTDRIREIAQSSIERWKEEVPPPNVTAVERQRSDLHESCEVFLRTEERECGSVIAKYFEMDFGNGTGPLPHFFIDLGEGRSLRVRGRIDRVDVDEGEKLWDVWDYKSGSTYKFDHGGRLLKGRRIQHALYARAIDALLKAEGLPGSVRRSGYYFPSRKGEGHRVAIDPQPRELERALNLLCDIAGAGTFLHGDAGECRFCDYRSICGSVDAVAADARRKTEGESEDSGVLAWRQLQEFE